MEKEDAGRRDGAWNGRDGTGKERVPGGETGYNGCMIDTPGQDLFSDRYDRAHMMAFDDILAVYSLWAGKRYGHTAALVMDIREVPFRPSPFVMERG